MSFLNLLGGPTRSERLRMETSQAISQVMHGIAADKVLLAEVIAQGPRRWRQVFAEQMRGYAVDQQIADSIYVFFCKAWNFTSHEVQGLDAATFLDKVEMPTPPTEQEIDDAWELDIASSEGAMAQFYEGSARTRKGGDFGAKKTGPH